MLRSMFAGLGALLVAATARAEVTYRTGPGGLASLRVGGFETLGDPGYQGQFCLYGCHATLRRADGSTHEVDGTPASSTWDGATLVLRTPFATIRATYRRLDRAGLAVDVAVVNTGTETIAGVGGVVFVLDMPVVPVGTSDYGTSELLAYPRVLDPARGVPALKIGFDRSGTVLLRMLDDPAAAIAAGATLGDLIHFNSDTRFSVSWQLDAPIAPGATGTVSLGVSQAAGTPTFARLAAATGQAYAGALPQTVGTWQDRRPIARWFLSSSVPHCAGGRNPRGWFNNDCAVDVTTPTGLAAFRQRMLDWTDTVIGNLGWLGAQGVVIWDIEGQQEPHATSYVCDPPMLDTVAPEMDFRPAGAARGVADEMVARIRAAGFHVGLCLRPQRYRWVGGAWQQPDQPDPGRAIAEKVAYAAARWGADIFYVDSNVHPEFGWPIPADALFGKALAAHPATLFIPEWMDPRYYAISAPYPGTLRPGATSSDPLPAAAYPGTFGIVLPDDATAAGNVARFTAAIRHGDILMPPAWYRPPSAVATEAAVRAAGPRPGVVLSAPADGSVIAYGQPVGLSAAIRPGPAAIDRVEYFSGGTRVAVADAPPWSAVWPRPAALRHSVVVRIHDVAGTSVASPPVALVVTP